MEEEKEVIENIKIIDNEEDTIDEINEDESDEEIEEDGTDELDESDEDEFEEDSEMDKTRKIDFSNKNEVYQDFFDEKKKSKFVIFFIVVFILLLIGVICYLVYINRDKIFNKIDNVVDNMDSLVDVEGDKDNSGGVVASTSSDDSSNVAYIYQKDSDSVAFTYNCKNKKCNVIVTKNGFILYDDDKVWYRDMSSYELEQINNTEKTPAKSELNFDGFEEVKSMFDKSSDSSTDLSTLFEISDVNYIIYKNELMTFDDYNEKFSGDRCKGSYKINDIIVLNCYAYNYKKNTEINFLDDLSFTMLDYGYESGFYYFHINTSMGDNIYVFDELGKNLTTVNSFYINDDKMYYEDGTNKVNVIDNKWKKVDYNNDDINAIYIYNDKLIYLNNEKILNVKNLVNNKDIQKTDVKMNDAYVLDVKDGINIIDRDYSILEKDDINEYIENENITEEEIFKIKQCIDNSDKCDEKIDTFHVGYLVKLDKDAKFVSRDYYIDIIYK